MAEFRAAAPDQAAFLEELVAARLLVPSGVPGVYGRGRVFEQIRTGFDASSPASRRPTAPSRCASRPCCRAASWRRPAT